MYAFLPFKGLRSAKSRWPLLGQRRVDLVLALLGQNLRTVAQVIPKDHVFLVTPDQDIPALFPGTPHLITPGRGLNQDLDIARTELITTHPIGPLIVLLPDLPTLAIEDISCLAESAQENPVVICPDEMGTGTNALALNPWDCLDFHFEGASCSRFLRAAEKAHIQAYSLQRQGLAKDCDSVEDLERYSLI